MLLANLSLGVRLGANKHNYLTQTPFNQSFSSVVGAFPITQDGAIRF